MVSPIRQPNENFSLSPIRENDHNLSVQLQRQYKKNQHHQLSAPNRNKTGKRMLFGEYDATLEEERAS